MMRRLVPVSVSALLILPACTGGAPPKPSPSQSVLPTPHRGGEAVFGAVFWPDCLNPVTYCAANSWTHFVVLQHVLPRALELDTRGNFVASPLLAEAPTFLNFGVQAGPPFTVTFRISPEAVWDDGSPIKSKDFQFTWKALLSTRGAYDTEGYELISSIDFSDPKVAVVRFRDAYVDWPNLFGGVDQYVLKAAAFPEVDQRHPNLRKWMERTLPFSGGPFKLESWNQTKAVLVRNDRYFGRQPLLDRVTFLAAHSQDLERSWLLSGHLSAIYPIIGLSGPPLSELFGGDPAVNLVTGDGEYFEALWLNHVKPPLDDPLVRAAFMYAIDRQAIIDRVVRPWNPNARVLNCGFVSLPDLGPWCRTHPFERFTYDPNRSQALLEAAGYACPTVPCTKGGKPLEIPYSVHSGVVSRTTTQALVIKQARAAGFSLVPRNYDSAGFGDPTRFATLIDIAVEGEADPSVTELLGCDAVASEENLFYGSNRANWCDRDADALMRESDRQAIRDRRLAIMEQIYEIEADDCVSLPLYVQPAVSVWRSDKIAGPIGAYNSSPYGLFFNMNEWYTVG
jgi:ABC-type transport system substrate-binding protein